MLTDAQNQQTYLKQLLENSPDGIFTIDMELRIRYVNKAFCEILDYEPDELIGTSITEHLGDLGILDACMHEVGETGRCNHQETIFRRHDGSMVHISKNVQAMYDDAGNIREILVTIRDMTRLHELNKELATSKEQLEQHAHQLEAIIEEREQTNTALKRTLAELRAAQKQLVEKEKLASLGGLVAGISHEINTPLGVSVTSASSMKEVLKELRQAFHDNALKRSELEEFLGHAEETCGILSRNLTRASNLVNSFKQIAVDQSTDEWRDLNLREYCNEILTSLHPQYKQRPITIENQCPPEISLHTHAGAIYQIVSNLLLNSLAHAYDAATSGKITIAARQDQDGVMLEYRDDGKGIAAEDLDKIFEPFFTTRRGQGGSGLGLSILYNLVTGTLKGSVSVESKPGEGTRFAILVPSRDDASRGVA